MLAEQMWGAELCWRPGTSSNAYSNTRIAIGATLFNPRSADGFQWGAVGNRQFVGPNVDSGRAINDPESTSPQSRIGVFAFLSGDDAAASRPRRMAGKAPRILFSMGTLSARCNPATTGIYSQITRRSAPPERRYRRVRRSRGGKGLAP